MKIYENLIINYFSFFLFLFQRKVILLDLPGFGLSCRPDLRVKRVDGWKREETTVDDIEDFYTEVLELWCQKMGLSKFILLGIRAFIIF